MDNVIDFVGPFDHVQAMQHFRREQPEEFVLHDKLAAAENGTVFRVAFMPRVGGLRIIRNLAAAVEVGVPGSYDGFIGFPLNSSFFS